MYSYITVTLPHALPRETVAVGRPRGAAVKKMLIWLTISFWVKKIRRYATDSQNGPWNLTRDRLSVKMLSNYHHHFGGCFLLEHSV